MDIEKEAERLANQRYIKSGYFGGKASKASQGAIGSIKYFDFYGTKQGYIDKLKNNKKIRV